jgi:uncharacterized protein (DUF885 family)
MAVWLTCVTTIVGPILGRLRRFEIRRENPFNAGLPAGGYMAQRQFVFGACALLLLSACGGPSNPASLQTAVATEEATAQQTETDRLNAWFEAVDRAHLDRFPMAKAYRNIVDEDYGSWGDPSDAFAVETFEIREAQLAEMKENFDYDALEPSAQLSWRLFEHGQLNARRNFPYRRHSYVFNQMFGPHEDVPVFLSTVHQVTSVETAEAWIARARGAEALLDAHIEEANARFDNDVHPPRWVYDHIINSARNVISGAPFDDGDANVAWESFERRVQALDADDATKARLLEEGRRAMLESWVPAYERLIAVMADHQSRAGGDDGVWRLPDGAAYYDARLAHFTTTDLTADEIHEMGVEHVARIHDEMRAIMAEVGFDGTLRDFFGFMRDDPQFYYPNTDEGRERYLTEARQLIDVISERLPEYFATLPRHELEVRRVETFRERSAGKAFYNSPAPDGSRAGIYYVNLYDMADVPIYQMEALAYHEGNPGHHMQISIAMDLEDLPAFRRFGGYTAYSEGWGLYAEYLPREMGFYEDPYSNFGRLAMELWRAGRLVVDTGLHVKRWTRDEAVQWLVENTPNSEGDAIREIERYIVLPGQATAYMVGMQKILELREWARAELGDRFDIREFHDVVLRDGAVPLVVLEDLVREWVQGA